MLKTGLQHIKWVNIAENTVSLLINLTELHPPLPIFLLRITDVASRDLDDRIMLLTASVGNII